LAINTASGLTFLTSAIAALALRAPTGAATGNALPPSRVNAAMKEKARDWPYEPSE
jgi:hypothetical protein